MTQSVDIDALREALTPPMMEMLRTRFPAWANDSGGYRYAEFIDRIAGIVAEAGCVIPPDVGHEFTEDVADASMCICGIPALTHDSVYPPGSGVTP